MFLFVIIRYYVKAIFFVCNFCVCLFSKFLCFFYVFLCFFFLIFWFVFCGGWWLWGLVLNVGCLCGISNNYPGRPECPELVIKLKLGVVVVVGGVYECVGVFVRK